MATKRTASRPAPAGAGEKSARAAARAVSIAPIMVPPQVAAQMLGVGLRTLYRLTAAGKIKPRQISPGRTGYLVRDLEAFAEGLPAAGEFGVASARRG